MTAIVAGAGLGLEQTSGRILGGRGLLGWAAQGRGGDLVTVNAATGNLIIQKQDELLIGHGPDLVTARTYNSLGQFTDDNGDNWRMSADRRVFGLTGTANAAGSTIKRVSGDGSVASYVWKGSYYETTDGAGAHDRLTYASNQWTWTDGDSRITEVYSASGTDNWRIVEQRDLDNNKLTFEYTADKLTRVKTEYASHPTYAEYTDYVWTGNNIASIVTGYDDLSTTPNTIVTLTRTRYAYDASNRLTQVTVDLSPEDNSIADGKTYTTTYAYVGATKLVSSIAQTDGSLLEIAYDGSNRVTQLTQTAAGGDTRITSFAYFADRTEVTDPRHSGLPTPPKTILYRNGANQLTKIVSPPAQTGAAPQTVEFAYDAATGDVLSVTETGVAQPNRVTSYVYDTKGNVTRITDPNGNITDRAYDANNSLTLETRTGSSSGAASGSFYARYVYDGENHLRYAISAEGRVTEYRYLATGELQFTIEYPEHPYSPIDAVVPAESAMNIWRDGLADLSTTKIAEYRYDARGNVSETVQWGAALATGFGVSGTEGLRDSLFTYDQAGQLLQRSTAPHVAETFVYDGMGRMILSTDLAGSTTQVIFQDAATTTVVKTAMSYNATTQTWDETAASYVTTSVYNKAGDLISTTDTGSTAGGNQTNGGPQAYLYDKNGQLRKTTDATAYKSYFLYDKTGRKVADIGHDGQLVEYRYDEAGRLSATVRYQNVLTTAQLATLDNSLSEVELGPPGSAFPRPAAHSWDIWQWSIYDAAGRVIETIEGDGSVIRYEYDQADRLVKTTGFVNKLTSTQTTAFMSAAPAAPVLPTAHANDRITRTFYDRDGRLTGALNAEGHLSRCIYDSAGQKVQEIAYANATLDTLRVSGTFDQLLGSITQDAAKDISTRYVYDGQGLLRFTIDALNRVTENVYWVNNAWNANGLVRKSVAYAVPLSAPNYKYATVKAAVAALASSSNDRATYFFYNNRAELAYSVDATGAVTGLTYDVAGRVVKTTQYATRIADMTGVPLDDPWWMNTWAASNGADVRITRNYYAERGDLRFVVDAEGYVTRNDYDTEGRLFTQYRHATQIVATDLSTIAEIDSAPKGASVATQFRYDRLGRLQDVYDGNGMRRFIGYYANGTQAWEIVSYGQGMDESRIRYFYNQAGKKIIERRTTSETENASTPITVTYASLLTQAQRIISPNGQYSALLSREGELRVYHKGELIWRNGVSETVAGATYRLAAQSDGNLVIYRVVSGQADVGIWSSNTAGSHSGVTFLEMQDDGNLVYKKGTDPANQAGAIWSTATTGVVASDPNASEFVDTTFAYDGLGNLTSVKDAKNNATTFTHDKVGRVLTRTDALSGVTQFQYDAFGRGVKTIDARGNASYVYFDQAGRVKLAIDAENYATRMIYTAFSEVKEVTRFYNRAANVGNLAQEPSVATHGLDATTKFEYDRLGRVTKAIDAQTDAQGVDGYEQYTLDAFGQRTSVRNKLGGWTNYVYDKRGLLVTETLPVNSVRADGTVQTANVVNKFEYDSRRNRTKTIEAFGLTEARTITYAYDAADRLISTTGDTVNAVASATSAEAAVAPIEQLFYDRRGNVIEKKDAANARTLFWYDKLNRVTHQLSALGTLTRYFYDKNGNVTETRIYATPVDLPADAKGLPPDGGTSGYRHTKYVYDTLNRLIEVRTPDVQTAKFETSFATTTGDVVTRHQYDATGNVVLTTNAIVVDTVETDAVRTYSYYDELGRRTTQIDGENYRTDWIYNEDGNVITERRYSLASAPPASTTTPPAPPSTNADDRVTEFTYDMMGRRLTEKRLGVLVHNGSGAHMLQDSTIAYSYNGLGEVTRKTEATGEFISYAYDLGGRMTSEQRSAFVAFDGQTSVTPTVEYSYNGLSDLSRTRQLGSTGAAAAGERVTTYAYGAGGRLLTRTDAEGFVRTYRYDAVGRTTREEYVRVMPTGSATEAVGYDYDLEGRVLQHGIVVYSGGSWTRSDAAIDTAMMHYNAFGEVSERGMNGVYAEKFDYDDAGRLWRTTSGDGTWKYFTYDRAGNQTLAIASDGTNIDNQTLDWVLDRWGADRAAIGTTYVDGVVATITLYDGRNQAIEVREPQRELSTALREDLITRRAYNAFGDVKSETNALGYTIDYAHNTMGRRIKTESPQVSITLENGTTQNVRPTEHVYYDISGRLVANRDANGNLTRLTLLAGTGYGGARALATAVMTVDNAVVATGYDIHGDARKITDQLNRVTTQAFDRMGRLVQTNKIGDLIEYYRFDGLGQQIRRFNSFYNPSYNPASDPTGAAAINAETVTYDQQGRITQLVAMGGDATTYAYAWDSAIAVTGLGTFGGWTQTTTFANTRVLTEKTDVFGRMTYKKDLGDHETNFTYDAAGRLLQRSGAPSDGDTITYAYFNTSRRGTITAVNSEIVGIPQPSLGPPTKTDIFTRTETFGYDKAGNVVSETLNATDVINRWHLYPPGGWLAAYWDDPVTLNYAYKNVSAQYDALGRMTSWSEAGSAATPGASILYKYDANGNVRNSLATFKTLDAQGNVSASTTTQDYWYRYDALNRVVTQKGTLSGSVIVRSATGVDLAYDAAGQRASALTNANSETYTYDTAGRLAQVNGGGVRRSTFTYDGMGRVTAQNDYEGNGTTVAFSRAVSYNAQGQIDTDDSSTKRGSTVFRSLATYGYGAGVDYALGSAVTITTNNWEGGSVRPTTLTTNGYQWWDGAVTGTIFFDPDINQSGVNNWSTYDYWNVSGQAQLKSISISDGRPRTVTFVNDVDGQAFKRDESDNNTANGDPHEIWYRFNGKQAGYVGNNGTLDTDYSTSIAVHQQTPGSGAFRNGSTTSTSYADFDQSIAPINSYSQGSASGSYTVRTGETLASIAAQLWGDSSLWYKLAEANGLSGGATLIEGQILAIPTGVMKSTHNASTFTPYDQNEVIGETLPTTPRAQKKKGCGVFGQILLVVIAVVVSIYTAGAATAALMGAFNAAAGSMAAVAAGAIGGAIGGAAGSIASQAVGVATGIQDKFSWNAVALAAVGGAMGAGSGVGGSFGGKVVSGMINNAMTQGIGVAMGWQEKFSWAGVAAAGVAAGVGHAMGGGKLRPLYGENASRSLGNIGAHLGVGAARSIASAATRSLIEGSDFGDNMLAALPDVIGQTIGEAIAGGIAEAARPKPPSPTAPDASVQDSTVTAAQVTGTTSIPQGATAPVAGTVLSLDEFVAGLPDNYRADIAKSDALTADFERFKTHDIRGRPGRRLQIEIVADGSGTNFDSSSGRIRLERSYYGSADRLIQAISHEIGHAYRRFALSSTDWEDPARFRRAMGREEANAQWHALVVIDQIYGIDNVRPGLFGKNGASYVGIYKQQRDAGTEATFRPALDRMAADIANEHPSGKPPGSTYLDMWRADYNADANRQNAWVDRENTRLREEYPAYVERVEEYNRNIPPSLRRPPDPLQVLPRRPLWN